MSKFVMDLEVFIYSAKTKREVAYPVTANVDRDNRRLSPV
jgi:hypothetical protein